jgi:hypothetical protein
MNSTPAATRRVTTPEAWAAAMLIPLAAILGLAASSRTGTLLVLLLTLGLFCAVGVRHRWGSVICIAPVFLFPVTVMTTLPSSGPLYWRFILAVVSAVLATAYWCQGAGRPTLNRWSFSAVGFLLVALVVLGQGTHASLQNSLSLPLFAYSGLIVGQCLRDRVAIRAIAVLAVPLAMLAILEALGLRNVWGKWLHANADLVTAMHSAARSTASFGHPLIAGACLAATGLLLLSLRERLMAGAGLICIFAAVTTVSRSALLGAALGLTILVVQARGHRTRIAVTATVLVVAMFAIVNSVPALQSSFNDRVTGLNQTTLAREETVRTNSLSILKNEFSVDPDRLFVGGGVGYSVRVLTARGGNAAGYNIFDNEYITMLYDAGLFVVLVIFALLARATVTSATLGRRAALPALASLVVVMYFVDGMEWPSLSFLTWMVIGFFTIPLASTRAPHGSRRAATIDGHVHEPVHPELAGANTD